MSELQLNPERVCTERCAGSHQSSSTGRGWTRLAACRAYSLLCVWLLLAVLLACKKTSSDDKRSVGATLSDESAENQATQEEQAEADQGGDRADSGPAADEPKTAIAAGVSDPPSDGAKFPVGTPVDVEWGGSWWKASVIQVKDGPQYKIHYVGWASSWDEWVGPTRIRPRTAGSRTK